MLGQTVVRAERVRGGVTSVVHRARVVGPESQPINVMLRRVPPKPDAPDHDPTVTVLAESYALRLLDGLGPSPRLLAFDTSGTACGVPALISTWLRGRPVVVPADRTRWVRGLAAAVHAVPTDTSGFEQFASFSPWFATDMRPPSWSRVPDAWAHALDTLRASLPPGGPIQVVHRDLHPANVLFSRGTLTGIVDWANLSLGPREVDISRCRIEVALLTDLDTADTFLRECTDPANYDPMWDALVAFELADWVDDILEFNAIGATLRRQEIRATLDTFVERAVGA